MKIKNVSKEDLSGIDTYVNGVEIPIKSGQTIDLPDAIAGILVRRLDPKVIDSKLENSRDNVPDKVEPKKNIEVKKPVKKIEIKKTKKSK